MTITCTCWRCAGKAYNDGTRHATQGIPSWTWNWTRHPDPDPLTVDEEPWTRHRIPPCEDPACDLCHDPDRGHWIGCVLILVALVIGIVIGRLTS